MWKTVSGDSGHQVDFPRGSPSSLLLELTLLPHAPWQSCWRLPLSSLSPSHQPLNPPLELVSQEWLLHSSPILQPSPGVNLTSWPPWLFWLSAVCGCQVSYFFDPQRTSFWPLPVHLCSSHWQLFTVFTLVHLSSHSVCSSYFTVLLFLPQSLLFFSLFFFSLFLFYSCTFFFFAIFYIFIFDSFYLVI